MCTAVNNTKVWPALFKSSLQLRRVQDANIRTTSVLGYKTCISCLVLSCRLWQLRPFVTLCYWKIQLLKWVTCWVILTVLGKPNITPFSQTDNTLHHYCFYSTYKNRTTTHLYKTDIPFSHMTQHSRTQPMLPIATKALLCSYLPVIPRITPTIMRSKAGSITVPVSKRRSFRNCC